MRCALRSTAGKHAFTLVEVLIVVVVIGILAAIVVPFYASASDGSSATALANIVRIVQAKVDEQIARTGAKPATIDPTWFAGGQLPTNPENSVGVPALEVVNTAGLMDPANKVLVAGVAGAYWYNAALGVFRARVAARATSAATLTVYNQVNLTSQTDVGNFPSGGGGGSGGSGS